MTEMDKVLAFWFEELGPKQWFAKSGELDRRIERQFGRLWERARLGELYSWRDSASGRLAEILVLDQFSRNLFRDDPRAFAQDGQALVLAQEAVVSGADRSLPPERRAFLYMPYMHSESRIIHEQAMRLFDQPGLEKNLHFEVRHRDIIERFGRYPHRNAILGRVNTREEEEFLAQPGSGF